MEKNIPTREETVNDVKLQVYEWLTQSEEDEYLMILANGRSIIELQNDENALGNVGYEVMTKARDFLVDHLLKSPSRTEIECFKPEIRQAIYAFIQGQYSDLKKK